MQRNQNNAIAPTQTSIPLAPRCWLPVQDECHPLARSLSVAGGTDATTERKEARTFVIEQQKMHSDHNLFGCFDMGGSAAAAAAATIKFLRVIRLGVIIIIQICKLLVYALPQSQTYYC